MQCRRIVHYFIDFATHPVNDYENMSKVRKGKEMYRSNLQHPAHMRMRNDDNQGVALVWSTP
jgi:hypothetical protein